MKWMVVALTLVAAQPLAAKALKIVTPLAAGVVGANHVVAVDVTVGEAAAKTVAALEAKAAAKRSAAGLSPADPAAGEATDPYATLPLARMLPLEIRDVTTKWGLTGGRAVKLAVTVDTLKTADAGMAMLLGSADQLAGLVSVSDADTGAALGEFYVDVVNFRSGMLGLALRGSGVREKLAAEFAKHIGEALSGQKHPLGKPA